MYRNDLVLHRPQIPFLGKGRILCHLCPMLSMLPFGLLEWFLGEAARTSGSTEVWERQPTLVQESPEILDTKSPYLEFLSLCVSAEISEAGLWHGESFGVCVNLPGLGNGELAHTHSRSPSMISCTWVLVACFAFLLRVKWVYGADRHGSVFSLELLKLCMIWYKMNFDTFLFWKAKES